jgi:hypothetical protein
MEVLRYFDLSRLKPAWARNEAAKFKDHVLIIYAPVIPDGKAFWL